MSLDFDGVLHWYRNGWQSPDIIDDEPVPGAVEFVKQAQEYFKVVVYSSRSGHPGGIEAMRDWMRKYGFPEVEFVTEKPAAFLTIDDRALTFTGSWPDPKSLRAFQPWTKSEQDRNRQTEDAQGASPTPIKERTLMLKDLVKKNRSVRRFYQDAPIEKQTLRELVDLARLAPTGSNLQSLKYLISCEPEKNALIFPTLIWAGYLKDWPGPEEGERPTGYIIILGDASISKSFGCDHGIAAQTIMLGAAEKDLAGCMIGSIRRADLAGALNIPPQYEILLVLALGKAKEIVQIDPIGEDGSVRYWRDEERVHHVPKRALDDIILP